MTDEELARLSLADRPGPRRAHPGGDGGVDRRGDHRRPLGRRRRAAAPAPTARSTARPTADRAPGAAVPVRRRGGGPGRRTGAPDGRGPRGAPLTGAAGPAPRGEAGARSARRTPPDPPGGGRGGARWHPPRTDEEPTRPRGAGSGGTTRGTPMRIRSLAVAGLAAVLLTACGGGGGSGNGEAAKKGPQVATDAADALEQSGAAHLTGSITEQGQSGDVDLHLQGADVSGSIALGGQPGPADQHRRQDLRPAPAAFWSTFGAPASVAGQLDGQWVDRPRARPRARFGTFTLTGLADELRKPSGGSSRTRSARTRCTGRRSSWSRRPTAAPSTWPRPATPYPLTAENKGTDSPGTLHLRRLREEDDDHRAGRRPGPLAARRRLTGPRGPAPRPGRGPKVAPMPESTATEVYRAARDQLLRPARRTRDRAVAEFRWPEFAGPFNWAVDWFDAVARGNDRPALRIVEEDGRQRQLDLRRDGAPLRPGRRPGCAGTACAAGDRVVADARQPGRAVGVDARGDEARRGDHADHHRARARPTWPTGSAAAARGTSSSTPPTPGSSTTVAGDYTRIAVGDACRSGWLAYADAADADDAPPGHPGTAAGDPLLLYFTSGTTQPAQAGRAHPGQLPRRPPATMYWLGPAPRRRAPEHLLARLGQARVELLLRAVDRGGDDLPLQLHPLRRRARCSRQHPRATGSPPSARRRRCGGC